MSNANERIEKLKREIGDLRNEVKCMRDSLMQQNELIISLVSKQTGMLNETLKRDMSSSTAIASNNSKAISEQLRQFPLESLEELKNFENEINTETREDIISAMRSLLMPQGIVKNISNILSANIIMKVNMDGLHGKKRLLNFPQTLDVIYLASRSDDSYTHKMFLDDLRRSLRVVKIRCHKSKSRERQKQLQLEGQEKAESGDESSFIEKTEEIYFD